MKASRFPALALLLPALSLFFTDASAARWFKGNLHTHTFWSDGDDFPEMVADWYAKNGYDFLAFSDHNSIQDTEKWVPMHTSERQRALEKYVARFGNAWVERRPGTSTNDAGARIDVDEVRLKRFDEFSPRVTKRGRFIVIRGEEISARRLTVPIHLGGINVKELIEPRGGDSIVEVMQANVDAVYEQRERTGQLMFPHINHPNFRWAVTAEELMQVRRGQFFELYNGHPYVHNEGDAQRAHTERVWDIILTRRLAELGLGLMYGIATDDSHHYHELSPTKSNTGRGWVVVRARELTPDRLIEAMEAGDFYASCGVRLKEVKATAKEYRVEVAPERGVTYRIQFIGTRKGFDPRSEPVTGSQGTEVRVTRRYSDDVGKVLQETSGTSARYRFQGDELYVRAKVISSRLNRAEIKGKEGATVCVTELSRNPFAFEAAWTQPVIPGQALPRR